MLFHSIILNFGLSPLVPELKELLKTSFPDAHHPVRIAGFYSSRNSLLDNLRKIHPEADFNQLEMLDHAHLKNYPDIVLSLSHTPQAGASVVGKRDEFISVGIDIESRDRVVRDNVIERVTTQKDIKLKNIEIWCLKEAIYKCVSNSGLFSGTLEFRDMENHHGHWNHSPSGLNGEWKQFRELNHQVAIATLKNQNSSMPDLGQ